MVKSFEEEFNKLIYYPFTERVECFLLYRRRFLEQPPFCLFLISRKFFEKVRDRLSEG